MNITLEKITDVTAKLILKVEEADYAANMEKSLKNMRQKANMPGFRKGMVPMTLVRKMYGDSVKYEEVNSFVAKTIQNYINENHVPILLDPMVSEDQAQIDIVNGKEFEFCFDLGLAPQFSLELNEKDEVTYYDIEIDEKMVDTQVENYRRRAGKTISVEDYNGDNDLLRGSLVELAEDQTEKEGGISLDTVSLMPKFFKNDDQKALFNQAKKGDNIVFNVSKAYEGNESEVASLLKIQKENIGEHTGDFKFQINEVSRFEMAEINQELFDAIYGPGAVNSEEEFRNRIKEEMSKAYERDSDYKFLLDLREYAMQKVGELTFPEEIMKRAILNACKEEEKANIDKYLQENVKNGKWSLVRGTLAENAKIKIDDDDVKDAIREAVQIQFAQYGMNNVPEEMMDKYVNETMGNKQQLESYVTRALDRKLMESYKKIVTLKHQAVSVEDFNKMFETA